MFNFSQHSELKVLTKIKRNLTLESQEETIKADPELLKPLEWQFKKYIGTLHLPVYGNAQFFNYHECLAAFAKQVFSNTHRKEFLERKKRIKNAEEAQTMNKLRRIDRIVLEDEDYWALDVMD